MPDPIKHKPQPPLEDRLMQAGIEALNALTELCDRTNRGGLTAHELDLAIEWQDRFTRKIRRPDNL